MRLTYVSDHFDPSIRNVDELFERYHASTGWCTAVQRFGIEVTWVQRFSSDAIESFGGVRVELIRQEAKVSSKIVPSRKLVRTVLNTAPDVVHMNGTPYVLPWYEWTLQPSTALVWQHHGGPSPKGLRRRFYRFALRFADGLLFSSKEIADAWKTTGTLTDDANDYEIIEASTAFVPFSKTEARMKTHMIGDPVFLWVGRLDANKDPMSVIRAFARSLTHFRDPKLFMVFSEGMLREEVQALISQSRLEERVRLLGSIKHDQLPYYYSSADAFILGSREEGSGFALIEALACGVTPLVTDIPAFRAITHGGSVGFLWQPGNVESLSQALMAFSRHQTDGLRVRNFFDDTLHYDVIGRKARDIYSSIMEKKVCSAS